MDRERQVPVGGHGSHSVGERALRESEPQEVQLLRNTWRNGPQEAAGERAGEENKESDREAREDVASGASQT